jgi:membrane-bound lytic murein transglycosylase D
VEQIDRRGLPIDLVLVPMVESAFEPTAVSPKEAAGLWQIIPTTGQERGLLLADGYDGRFDIHHSTEAALDYLRHLNAMFKGDWLLALAAYNAGPGAVREAIKASANTPPPIALVETQPAIALALAASVAAELKPRSPYWSLKLPRETQDYVPRILALSRIVANPEAYGLQLPVVSNQPYLFRVDVAPEVRIPDALAATGIPADEFFRFNPGFKPGVEPPPGAYKLLLPWEQARNLAATVPGTRLVVANRYTVKKGETLTLIARRHGVPSQQLAQWNRLSVDSVLKAGQQLLVYPAS